MPLAAALKSANVCNSIKQAWLETQRTGVEYGGWIFEIGATDTYTVAMAPHGGANSIVLTGPVLTAATKANYKVMADFHCHPFTAAPLVASGRPSDADISNAKGLPYGRLVFTPDANHLYGNEVYRKADPRPVPADLKLDDVVMWQIA